MNETRRAILDVQDAEQFGVYIFVFKRGRSGQGAIMIQQQGKWHSLKRCILNLQGRARGTVVYCKDGDPFNLRRENLVTGSHRASCNNSNLPNRKKKSARYTGVRHQNGAWVAHITIGSYPTDLEAAQAYNSAARKLGLPEDAMNVLPLPAANVLGMFEDEPTSSPDLETNQPLEFEV